MKVKSGCRVSITFYIQRDEEVEELNEVLFSPKVVSMGDKILNKLNKKNIGLLLSHKYSYSEYQNGIYKGSDAKLINYLTNKCNVSKVVPVVISHDECWGDQWTENSVEESIYRFTDNDINVTALRINDKLIHYEPVQYSNIDFINLGSPYMSLDSKSGDYIEYTGNESQEGFLNGKYFNLAVILSNL